MFEYKQTKIKPRFLEIDFIRSIAIVLMVFTHVAIYFYDFGNEITTTIADIGGYLCFSLFLFDSGVTVPISIENHSVDYERKRLLNRAGVFFLLYILFGIMFGGLGQIGGILLLIDMPIFADFLFGLCIFFLFGAVMTRFMNKENIMLVISTSIIALFIGFNLYFSQQSGAFTSLKAILFGHEGLHRFPLMQYSLIYLSGIVYGMRRNELTLKKNIIVFATLLISTLIANSQWGFDRWAATPAFILTGITTAFGMIIIWQILERIEFKYKQRIINYMVHLSKNAIGVLIVHLVAIFILTKIFTVTFAFWIAIPLAAMILGVSLLLGEKIKL